MVFERRSMLRVQAVVLGALLAVGGAAQTAGLGTCMHHLADAGHSSSEGGSESHQTGSPGHHPGHHDTESPDPGEHSDDACRLHCMLLGHSTPVEGPAVASAESTLPSTVASSDAPDDADAAKPTHLRFFLPFSHAPPTSA